MGWTTRPLFVIFSRSPVLKSIYRPPDVNTEIENLKATVVKLIKAGVPVFFGCDVGKHSNSALGIMDLKLFDYEVRTLPRIIRTSFNGDLTDSFQHQTRFDEEAASSSSRVGHDTCDGYLWCTRRP